MVIRRRRTKQRCNVSCIFIRKYGKRRMPIDMLKRQCSGRLKTEDGERRKESSAKRSVRQLHETRLWKERGKRIIQKKVK